MKKKKFLLLLCAVFIVSENHSVEVYEHPSGYPKPMEVRIEGCDVSPCQFTIGSSNEIEVDLLFYYPTAITNVGVGFTMLGMTFDYYGTYYCYLGYDYDNTIHMDLFINDMFPSIDTELTVTVMGSEYSYGRTEHGCMVAGFSVELALCH